ncbi:transcription factor FAMA [Andrographis paniculata]|uniref:transcription factor FAMA n=1 Tax=Andrographis paniculata TaxID=175694 RepID=UPI0021E95373|nr:transcription factor FAMA [Andrographis paniculata]XP_051127956.1 transcription factor FAMA [Andrographis paniculata]
MEKEGTYSGNFPGLDYSSLEVQNQQQNMASASADQSSSNQMVDYMLNNTPVPAPASAQAPPLLPAFCGSNSFDKLSFADVMQFADFGPKLSLNQTKSSCDQEDTGIDPVYFLKFPVLNDHQKQLQQEQHVSQQYCKLGDSQDGDGEDNKMRRRSFAGEKSEEGGAVGKNCSSSSSKRKRARTVKTSEEVESQRMTHIAVERNRRKQMNEHLRVLRSLMPTSYVQRGDQASIIGGAIEFVRELEQLLQCLESQKRRRLYGGVDSQSQTQRGDPSMASSSQQPQPQPHPPLMFPPPPPAAADHQYYECDDCEEETAERKSCLADVEVKLLGFDALIKILSRRRPGQLIKAIAALQQDLHLTILHTNITTIDQTVLYSFNVKVGGEARFTAEDIANSVQQIFSFIHANNGI